MRKMLKRLRRRFFCAYVRIMAGYRLKQLCGEIENDEYERLKYLFNQIAFDNSYVRTDEMYPHGYAAFAEYARELIEKYSVGEESESYGRT